MLRQLLSSTSQNMLQLIEYLLNNKETYLLELAQNLSISVSALKNYIDEINHEFAFLEVTIDSYSLVHLRWCDFASRVDVYSHFLTYSPAFQLLELLFSSNFSSYDMLASELNLSKSSIIRLIKKINQALEPYDFYIAKKPIQLTGNEENIRQFYLVFFLEKYQHELITANKNQEQEFLKIAHIMAEATPLKTYFSDVRKIAFVLYIHTKRDRFCQAETSLDHIEYFLEKIDFSDLTGYNQSQIEKIIGYTTSHIGEDPQTFREIKKEFLFLTEKIFATYNYQEEGFADKLDAVVFSYLLSVNMHVPYCILDDRLSRFVNNCSYAKKEINKGIRQILLQSKLALARPSTLNYLLYVFHCSFPYFTKHVIDKHAHYKLALFYDTTIDHTAYIQSKIQQFIPYQIDMTVLNPLDSFSLPLTNDSFDLIIGNISPTSQNIPFKYTDIIIKQADIDFIIKEIQKKGIARLNNHIASSLQEHAQFAYDAYQEFPCST
ncbi:helix-turn-helix domain-containing protein [Enterococcus sp. DIV0876]|uniref:helix-turn-helix domain-containing protein n=1 Tax=Enterococcus sp. DIV0876 TaxID=2774633 RepID=UPI003D301076